MGTDEFLPFLSRAPLKGFCKDTPVLPRQRVKGMRAALIEHFKDEKFVHSAALFAPDDAQLAVWAESDTVVEDTDAEGADEAIVDFVDDEVSGEYAEGFREAAE